MSLPYGLAWESRVIGSDPIWTAEPDLSAIELLARHHLAIPSLGQCDIAFLAQGAFNKVYTVSTRYRVFIFRVGLPVDPDKVASEVAAIAFLRERTHIPIPQVFAYDTSNDNVLRFPWILMELACGEPLTLRWRTMPLEDKRNVLKQLAAINAQLHVFRLDAIGSLTPCPVGRHHVSRMVTDRYYDCGDSDDGALGPHTTSGAWLHSRLERLLAGYTDCEYMPDDGDEDEEGFVARLGAVRDKSQYLMSGIDTVLQFHLPPNDPEPTALHHIDLHPRNILVDASGRITAILDWEFASALPLWMGYSLPRILRTQRRVHEPVKDEFAVSPDAHEQEWYHAELYIEGVNIMYWERLDEWEMTLLRPEYLSMMDALVPPDERGKRWSELYERTKFLRVIEDEISDLERGYSMVGDIDGWFEEYAGDGLPEGVLPEEDTLCGDEELDVYLAALAVKAAAAAAVANGECADVRSRSSELVVGPQALLQEH